MLSDMYMHDIMHIIYGSVLFLFYVESLFSVLILKLGLHMTLQLEKKEKTWKKKTLQKMQVNFPFTSFIGEYHKTKMLCTRSVLAIFHYILS